MVWAAALGLAVVAFVRVVNAEKLPTLSGLPMYYSLSALAKAKCRLIEQRDVQASMESTQGPSFKEFP